MQLSALLFSFQGRIGIGRFWQGVVLSIVALFAGALAAGFVIGLVTALTGGGHAAVQANAKSSLLTFALACCWFWMSFAVMVKRCHDRGKSGWWALVSLIPVAGFIWWLIALGLTQGDAGENDYGMAPNADPEDVYQRIESRVAVETAAIRPAAPQPVYRSPAPSRTAPAANTAPRPRREAPVFRPVG